MILLQQRFLRDLLLFMLVVLINVYLGIYIDSEVLKKNCFPYETAFENFRDEEVSEEVINSFLYDSEPMEENDITEQKIKSVKYADFAKLSEYLAMYQIFSEVGITDFTIHINDRQILRAAALQAGFDEEAIGSVLISLDKYDKIGLDGIRKELIENGYAEEVVTRYLSIYESLQGDVTCGDFCKDIAEEYLDRKVVDGVDDIISCAKAMINEHVKITFDPTLVRGMGYYTGTIFEISIDGYNFSIAGGGRYDKMIGKFCGQDVSARSEEHTSELQSLV